MVVVVGGDDCSLAGSSLGAAPFLHLSRVDAGDLGFEVVHILRRHVGIPLGLDEVEDTLGPQAVLERLADFIDRF